MHGRRTVVGALIGLLCLTVTVGAALSVCTSIPQPAQTVSRNKHKQQPVNDSAAAPATSIVPPTNHPSRGSGSNTSVHSPIDARVDNRPDVPYRERSPQVDHPRVDQLNIEFIDMQVADRSRLNTAFDAYEDSYKLYPGDEKDRLASFKWRARALYGANVSDMGYDVVDVDVPVGDGEFCGFAGDASGTIQVAQWFTEWDGEKYTDIFSLVGRQAESAQFAAHGFVYARASGAWYVGTQTCDVHRQELADLATLLAACDAVATQYDVTFCAYDVRSECVALVSVGGDQVFVVDTVGQRCVQCTGLTGVFGVHLLSADHILLVCDDEAIIELDVLHAQILDVKVYTDGIHRVVFDPPYGAALCRGYVMIFEIRTGLPVAAASISREWWHSMLWLRSGARELLNARSATEVRRYRW